VAVVVVVVAATYVIWAGYLAVVAGEGALPPRSRIPDLPSDARVLSETVECASGGCWREILVRPAGGQSPAELATELDLVDEQRHPWRLSDPHSVSVGSRVTGDDLRIYVQY
ncbi:MAG: hypothetical protein Q7T71_06100, partial [Herbiconiux sp.]|nr:hypothetical protein [Herbiconiux sp.]